MRDADTVVPVELSIRPNRVMLRCSCSSCCGHDEEK